MVGEYTDIFVKNYMSKWCYKPVTDVNNPNLFRLIK